MISAWNAQRASASPPITAPAAPVSAAPVLAISEHEHIPEVAAAALGEYLACQEHGADKIRDMIVDDIRASQARGDCDHVLTLLHVLHHFLRTHPEACPKQHPWSGRF